MRRLHYAIQTERAYCEWMMRYVGYHCFEIRDALLAAGAAEVEQFLSLLALDRKPAPRRRTRL